MAPRAAPSKSPPTGVSTGAGPAPKALQLRRWFRRLALGLGNRHPFKAECWAPRHGRLQRRRRAHVGVAPGTRREHGQLEGGPATVRGQVYSGTSALPKALKTG
jgi:hypothetical protein